MVSPSSWGPDAGAEEAFKKVARAFDTLSDAQKRAQYDRYGEAAEGRPSPPFQSNFQGFQQFHGFSGAQFQQVWFPGERVNRFRYSAVDTGLHIFYTIVRFKMP